MFKRQPQSYKMLAEDKQLNKGKEVEVQWGLEHPLERMDASTEVPIQTINSTVHRTSAIRWGLTVCMISSTSPMLSMLANS
jgi:hypothetical protein